MSEIQNIETAAVDDLKTAEKAAINSVDKVETESVHIADKVEAGAEAELAKAQEAFHEIVATSTEVENLIAATVEKDIIAPVENFVAAAEQEVKKIREVFVHPEIGQTRPVINTTLPHGGGSIVRNPA